MEARFSLIACSRQPQPALTSAHLAPWQRAHPNPHPALTLLCTAAQPATWALTAHHSRGRPVIAGRGDAAQQSPPAGTAAGERGVLGVSVPSSHAVFFASQLSALGLPASMHTWDGVLSHCAERGASPALVLRATQSKAQSTGDASDASPGWDFTHSDCGNCSVSCPSTGSGPSTNTFSSHAVRGAEDAGGTSTAGGEGGSAGDCTSEAGCCAKAGDAPDSPVLCELVMRRVGSPRGGAATPRKAGMSPLSSPRSSPRGTRDSWRSGSVAPVAAAVGDLLRGRTGSGRSTGEAEWSPFASRPDGLRQ